MQLRRESDKPASQRQIGGEHYKNFAIQPSEYCYRNQLHTLAANIIKYATRAGLKDGTGGMQKDIQKIIHYAELWLEYEGLAAPNEHVMIEGDQATVTCRYCGATSVDLQPDR